MADLPFRAFDADNHYYEPTDAFTRHMPRHLAKRGMQWAEIDGKTRLLVGGRINRFIPNPTFDPVARPGVLDDYFRGKIAAADLRDVFGALEPISPAYREPKARIELLDRQGLEGCLLFPTLAVGMEESLRPDPEAAHAAFHAFNQWLLEDWGYAHDGRIFAAPLITLLDPAKAAEEAEWVIGQGARLVCMRSAPVRGPGFSRSPGDPVYDPFWARINEAGITVAYHSGDSGYGFLAEAWGESAEMEAFRHNPFRNFVTGFRPVQDTIAALICHGVFARHPRVRVATIESGSDWVSGLLRGLGKSFKMQPDAFPGGDPRETIRRHVWVSPYYEDDVRRLTDLIGADRVLFGSDYPHAEGLADPTSYVEDLAGFSDDDVRRIMHDNAAGLVAPAPAAA